MKTGFSVFLAAFVALGASWFGFVNGPIRQLGGAKETTVLQSGDKWPQQRTGDATLGLQVYRANGCVACHTEQIRQTGAMSEISLTDLGARQPADFKEFVKALMLVPELMNHSNTIVGNLEDWNGGLPKVLFSSEEPAVVSMLADKLKPAGVKTD